MNFESRVTKQSETFEGVSFTLNKITEGRRIKLRLKLADATAELRAALAEVKALLGEEQPDEVKAGAAAEKVEGLVSDKITPAWVRWGLHSISGLEIDGQPATVESLIEDGPRDLYNEISAAIQAEAGLTDTQAGEFGPLTTSGAQVAGGTKSTSAETANDPASMPGATVESTSLAS